MHFSIKVPGAKQEGFLAVTLPFDGTEVGRVATVGLSGVEQALSNCEAVFHNRSDWLSAEQRADILEDVARLMASRYEQLISVAVAEGAELLTGGKIISESLYSPTGLLNPAESSKVSQQEIFGPVVCIYEYGEIEDAIARANALPYAFQAAVMTRSIDTVLFVFKHMQASAVMINDHTAFRVDWMPLCRS